MTRASLIWLLVEDGLTGTENQLKAVSEALTRTRPDVQFVWKKIRRGSWLMPRMDGSWFWDNDSARPDLVIAAGALSISPALGMKKRGARVAFLQDPRWFRSRFDVIYCAAHDPARGSNVVLTDGTLTRIGRCEGAPRPGAVFLIIGGARKKVEGHLDVQSLAPLAALESCFVTFSRRTPDSVKLQVRRALPNAQIFDPVSKDFNPYRDWMCTAETLLVTDDSTGMISDACSTGHAVYIVPYLRPTGRIARFHAHLVGLGAAKKFNGDVTHFVPPRILSDADNVAADIADRFLKG